MAITNERVREAYSEREAQAIYQEVRQSGDFVGFAQKFMHSDDSRVARNALWTLTKASDSELSQLQPLLDELVDLAMHTDSSAVRRLSLNLVERLEMDDDDLRTDFLDFCLEHMADIAELPGVQSISMKLAFCMCQFYPELMDEFRRTLEAMEIGYYKPAVKSVRNRILAGKMK